MKTGSKYFTPPLNARERASVQRMLGFDRIPSVLVERLAGKSCLARAIHSSTSALVTTGDEPIVHWLSSGEFHLAVVLDHEGSRFSLGHPITGAPNPTVWESIAPFPFSLLGTSQPFKLTVMPESAKSILDDLIGAVSRLHTWMLDQEATVVWIRSGEHRFPLLFHFVRGRIVRVGTGEKFSELGQKWEQGELDDAALSLAMGTRARFVSINLDTTILDPLTRLKEAFASAIGKTPHRAASPALDREPPPLNS